ncbi:hypothetical protein [[Mycobacterium] wendilense]|uniref:Uncharacterized protein n=1 Tax=[Mycobacterium] wendilense TaxID=3064284 RepID=A0ABN9NUF6_9MYCO|nr:hypothetical protein [Mycolicibacterium sp. MU0050]CAJ1579802.1 hypothetical protein MU0050_000695 [Mycolicibacterium sp. MU0050]
MSTSYRDLITNLHRGVHCDVSSARTRLQGVIELMDRAHLPAVAADLRAVEQRLVDQADR